MIIEYVGLAEKVEDGYSVFFPDFPGFGSAGDTLVEARKNAKEGLIAHIELMIEEREIMPKPTSLDNIMQLPDAKGCIPLISSLLHHQARRNESILQWIQHCLMLSIQQPLSSIKPDIITGGSSTEVID